MTDAEWEHIAPLIPPAKRGERKRSGENADQADKQGFSKRSKGEKL